MADQALIVFGVPGDATPALLLGLQAGETRPDRVLGALEQRLDLLAGRSDLPAPIAEELRQVMEEAARACLHAAPGSPRPPPVLRPPGSPAAVASSGPVQPVVAARRRRHALTGFDRAVLGILASGGGWNATTQGRLISQARAHGVSAEGLLSVIEGLNAWIADGGDRDESHPVSGTRLPIPMRSGGGRGVWFSRLLPEIGSTTTADTIKLLFLMGTVLVLLLALFMRAIRIDTETDHAPGSAGSAPLVTGEEPGDVLAQPARRRRTLARFEQWPTFLGEARPAVVRDAIDESAGLPGLLADVARNINASGELSDASRLTWQVSISTVSRCWVLVEPTLREAISGEVLSVLRSSAGKPELVDMLLEDLVPEMYRLDDPLAIWRASWKAGMLGDITISVDMTPSVTYASRVMLEDLGHAEAPETGAGFHSAVSGILASLGTTLAEKLSYDEMDEDQWEMWLAANRASRDPSRIEDGIMRIMGEVLAGPMDLSRPGPASNVLGRLLTEADFNSSGRIRDRFLAFFGNPSIDNGDLWVITSLLSSMDTAPWFREELVFALDAADGITPVRSRSTASAMIERAWPTAARAEASISPSQDPAIMLDAEDQHAWTSARSRVGEAHDLSSEEGMMFSLLQLVRLNKAALALEDARSRTAKMVLDGINESLEDGLPAAGGDAQPPARVIGPDGRWAARYREELNVGDRAQLLRALRTTAGGDLGPADAEQFVQVIYRGTPPQARELAGTILLEQFSEGPEIAMELLDQFPRAPRASFISVTLEELTGSSLPAPGHAGWKIQAREALLTHVIQLRNATSSIDDMAVDFAVVLQEQLALLRDDRSLNEGTLAPDRAMQLIAEAWMDRAQQHRVRQHRAAMEGHLQLAGIEDRRRNRGKIADGPVQRMVSDQLAVLEYLGYVIVAERPALEGIVVSLLDGARSRRMQAVHVLEQAVDIEATIASLWAIRMIAPGHAQAGEGASAGSSTSSPAGKGTGRRRPAKGRRQPPGAAAPSLSPGTGGQP